MLDSANARNRARVIRSRLEDPAHWIREMVAGALTKRFSLELLDFERTTRATAPEDVAKDYPGADLILDIRTSRWGLNRVRLGSDGNTAHFVIEYVGAMRLIDARNGVVIAEGGCSGDVVNSPDLPTSAQLLADDCALLKQKLAATAEYCTDRYRTWVLGLY